MATTTKLHIPPAHIGVLRETIKGELAADCHDLPSIEPKPDQFAALPRIEMHRATLDQIGWNEDDVPPEQIELELDGDYLMEMLASAMDTASSQIAATVGEYQGDKAPGTAAARSSAQDILWLADVWEEILAGDEDHVGVLDGAEVAA